MRPSSASLHIESILQGEKVVDVGSGVGQLVGVTAAGAANR